MNDNESMTRRSKSGNSRDFCSFLETLRRDAVPGVNFPMYQPLSVHMGTESNKM